MQKGTIMEEIAIITIKIDSNTRNNNNVRRQQNQQQEQEDD